MEKRALVLALVVVASSLASVSPAQADLTVSFATDGPSPALSATVVSSGAMPEPRPEPSAPAITPIAARFARIGSSESATFVLRNEEGDPGVEVLDRLSILARPRDTDVPAVLASDDPDYVAPGIRRLHAGLIPLLARLAEHFPDRAIEIVSGYRPDARSGSRHRFGRALDLRVEGVATAEVHAFLDGEPFTGVGLYPTSGFVHLDVRTETVRWTDESGPGEAPQIVRSELIARRRETPPPARDPEPASDAEAIEAAMRAADAIVLDLGLGP